MTAYIAKKIIQFLLGKNKNIQSCKALIMGATFKEDVSDIRNSKVFNLFKELKDYSLHVDIVDPFADAEEVTHEYGVQMSEAVGENYDVIVVAVNHEKYNQYDESFFKRIGVNDVILVDLKNIYRGNIKELTYWSL
jgi:UDP-N-acetyl-D-galactosamine dehydrogenase